MSKRRPDHQLTQNNWDEELEKDEIGEFQKADENEMKNRIIRKVKRRPRPDETDSMEVKPVSVFSGFSLVSNKSTVGGDGAVSASKPLFSFGNSFSSQQPASSVSAFGTMPSFNTQSKVDDNKSSEFIKKLKDLNDAVLKCIKGHIDSGNACILTPIFNDYQKYVKDLEDDKEKNPSTTTASPAKTNHVNATSATSAGFSFSFNAPKTVAETKTENSTLTASPVVSAPTQSTSVAPLFSFGKPSTTSTFGGSSSGFSFSSAIQTPKPTESDNQNGTNGNTENAEDDDEPPKVEFKPVVEDESIYSKRCKVFVKDDGDYKDRGTGTLYLKNVKDSEKVQLIVRADTNLGNILLNILLSSATPAKRLKNNVVLVCIPTPESEPKPRSVLVRVKTEDDAKELLETIEKYQN